MVTEKLTFSRTTGPPIGLYLVNFLFPFLFTRIT